MFTISASSFSHPSEQVQNYHSCQGHFSSTFSVVGSVNFRTRLERPLVHSIRDSEIFHVQLLKMLTKNDPGNYDNFVLVQKGRENDQDPDVPQLRRSGISCLSWVVFLSHNYCCWLLYVCRK